MPVMTILSILPLLSILTQIELSVYNSLYGIGSIACLRGIFIYTNIRVKKGLTRYFGFQDDSFVIKVKTADIFASSTLLAIREIDANV